MAHLLNISGPASALLLLAALLAADAQGDTVTTTECKARGAGRWVVRRCPVDSEATMLYLSGCSLTAIPERPLTGLPAVTSLDLSKNKLRELPVLHEDTCHNLAVLDLYGNQLTSIKSGTFTACTKLETLWLYENQIQFISHDVFTAMTKLKVLSLHGNKIRLIPDEMFSNNGKLVDLRLSDNMITHLPPHFASSLKRAAPRLDTFWFHDNPWHCACLIELLADVRRAGVRDYYKPAYSGAASVCGYVGAEPCSRRAPTGMLRAARGEGKRGA